MSEHYNKNPEKDIVKPQLEIIDRTKLLDFIGKLPKNDFMVSFLLKGDRIRGCDEGVIMTQQDKPIGVATIAPYGEEADVSLINFRKRLEKEGVKDLNKLQTEGEPTIVGLYVVPEERKKGYGRKILIRAVERCIKRGFEKIRTDVTTPEGEKTVQSLPDDIKSKLDVRE